MLRFLPLLAMVAGMAVFALVQFSGSNPRTATALTNCSLASEDEASLVLSERMLFDLVNNVRILAGLNPVQPSPSLNRAAAWMAIDMSTRPQNQISHNDTTGRGAFQRMADCGYAGSGNAGENIAWGSTNVCTIFQMWMESTAGHRENILNPAWRVMGVGNSGTNWVQDFGVYDDSGVPFTPYWDPLTNVNCANGVPTPAPTASVTITIGPTDTPSPSPSPTGTATPTATATTTETPSADPTPTESPAPMLTKVYAPMVVAEAN